MSLNAAQHAVQQESRTRLEVVVLAAAAPVTEATDPHHGKCSRRSVPHVEKTPRCLLNPVPAGRSTALIATAKRIRQKDINCQTMIQHGENCPAE